MITTVCLPPMILQSHSSKLLSRPACKFYQDSEFLWKMYQYTLSLKYKCKTQRSLQRFKEQEKQFLEIYERAKAKEKDLEGSAKHPSKRPFFYFQGPKRDRRKLYCKLIARSYHFEQ
jgi:hypothetical protein